MSTIRCWAAVAVVLLSACGGEARAECRESGAVVHMVVVWMKDAHRTAEAVETLIAGHEMLREIPGLKALTVGRPVSSDRLVVDDSFDVAASFTFCSVDAMRTYLDHPTHVAFLERYTREVVDRVVVYDLTAD